MAQLGGVVALERHGTAGAPAFLLRSLAVRADPRGGGIDAALVTAALAAADADRSAPATVGLRTETAEGYFERFCFIPVDRSEADDVLSAPLDVGDHAGTLDRPDDPENAYGLRSSWSATMV